MSSLQTELEQREEELERKSWDLIRMFLGQVGGDPWMAWQVAAIRRVEVDYTDVAMARAEHYLLRYALASSDLERLIEKFQSFDGRWYHTIIKPMKCRFGMSSRDRSLPEWEELGYQHGWELRERAFLFGEGGNSNDSDEAAAKQFMLDTTNAVIELLDSDSELKKKRRAVYLWMKLLRWYQE